MTEWRVGHLGRDMMYYEERHNGTWLRLEIQGEMLMGPAHHVIYLDPPVRWQHHPEWARHRRDEIIARIKSEFREPDYEYGENVSTPPVSQRTHASTRKTPPQSATPSQKRALGLAIALMFLLAAGMGWLVARGLSRGETFLPSKRALQGRVVMRTNEPVMYWVSVGIYAVVGLGAFGLGAWGVRAGRKLQVG